MADSMTPKAKPGQYSIVFAEVKTGKVCTSDGKPFRKDQGEYYTVFDSLENAQQFARSYVDGFPDLECSVYDSTGKHLESVRNAMWLQQ
jgi:hypothetical protein